MEDGCSKHIQCTDGLEEFSSCADWKCQCWKNGGVPSEDNRLCLPIRNELRRPCVEDQQCLKGTPGTNSICAADPDDPTTKSCQCSKHGVSELGTKSCLKKAELVGNPCSKNFQCQKSLDEESTCRNSQCICPKDFALPNENNNKCLPIVNAPRRECVEDRQCQAGVPGYCSRTAVPKAGTPIRQFTCETGSVHGCHGHNATSWRNKCGTRARITYSVIRGIVPEESAPASQTVGYLLLISSVENVFPCSNIFWKYSGLSDSGWF